MAEAGRAHVMAGLPPDRLANLLWALAVLRHKPPAPWLRACLLQVRLQSCTGEFYWGGHWRSALWALAVLRHKRARA